MIAAVGIRSRDKNIWSISYTAGLSWASIKYEAISARIIPKKGYQVPQNVAIQVAAVILVLMAKPLYLHGPGGK